MKVLQQEVEGYLVHIYFHDYDSDMIQRLNESSRKYYDINNLYSLAVDKQHIPSMKQHLHLFKRGNEILAMNFDGTSSHGYHNVKIPNVVQDWLRDSLPYVTMPTSGIIESITPQTLEQKESDIFVHMYKWFKEYYGD